MREVDKLAVFYKAATPGEWNEIDGQLVGDQKNKDGSYLICDIAPGDVAINEQDAHNAAYICMAHNLMPQLLAAVGALEDLKTLVLEMGHEIRSLDENSVLLGYWTNDGEYIIDERFGKAARILEKLK